MEDKVYNKEELISELEAIALEMPNNTNPRKPEHDICLYTAVNNPDRHCLIGQLAARLGWSVPGPDYEGSANGACRDYSWPIAEGAEAYLGEVQNIADGNERDRYGSVVRVSRTWGDIEFPRG